MSDSCDESFEYCSEICVCVCTPNRQLPNPVSSVTVGGLIKDIYVQWSRAGVGRWSLMIKEHYFNSILGNKIFKLLTHCFLSKSQLLTLCSWCVYNELTRKGVCGRRMELLSMYSFSTLKETFPLILHFLITVCAFSNHFEETKSPYFSLGETSSQIPRVRMPTSWKVILKLFLTQSTELPMSHWRPNATQWKPCRNLTLLF